MVQLVEAAPLEQFRPDRKNSRHSREGGNPEGCEPRHCGCYWIPAPDRVEGMTVTGFEHAWILQVRLKPF
jgi:hypothetical protein